MPQQEPDIQVDFSGGQVNLAARRRSDIPLVRTGARTMRNFRPTTTGQAKYRPGRRALYPSGASRGDYFRVSTGEEFQVRFPPNQIQIVDATGAVVASSLLAAYPWTTDTAKRISWAQSQDSLFVAYGGMQPVIVLWDRGTRQWSFLPFTFDESNGVKYQPYYRSSALGARMAYSASTGSVDLTCTADFFKPGMIGETISIVGQQVTITAVTDATHATATPAYRLPDTIKVQVVDTNIFQVGQIVSATTQNIKFEVAYIDTVGKWVHGILLSQLTFQVGQFDGTDTLVSPLGASLFAAAPAAGNTNLSTIQWQEELMNARVGWPASVNYDRGRLIFCDFPQAANAILWSAISAMQTFWIDSVAAGTQPAAGANANAAILDLITGSPHVRYVVGWQQGQFVFTDRGTYFVPISNSNPLIPGSASFDKISDDGVAQIRPVTIQDAIVFINAGLTRVCAVRATGSYSRPMVVEDISDAHTELFKSPIQISVATGDGKFPERYIYIANGDGTVVVGRVLTAAGQAQMFVGWQPWVSAGDVTWVTAAGPNVFYTTQYQAGSYLVEAEDVGVFMDFCIQINAVPASMAPPNGKGLFWQLAGQVVTLMDGNIDMGDRSVDVIGNIIPQPGEDLSSPTIVAGIFTPAVMEPFIYGDKIDRQKRGNIGRVIANVRASTDFILGNRIFSVSRFGTDAMAQPVLLDGSYRARFLGRSYDPTISIIKHRPGPFELCELTTGVSN
jgi:hypothetical protein